MDDWLASKSLGMHLAPTPLIPSRGQLLGFKTSKSTIGKNAEGPSLAWYLAYDTNLTNLLSIES